MPDQPVLYMGDTTLATAAAYLAGVMTRAGIGFDYVPSDTPMTHGLLGDAESRRLFILSDFLCSMMPGDVQRAVVERVAQGAGLLMIGGWESFRGKSGHWAGSVIAGALPVEVSPEDDRVNCDQCAVPVKLVDHVVTRGLPWDEHPPTIGGLNRLRPRAATQTLMAVQRFAVKRAGERFEFTPTDRLPMLVVGTHGRGRTAALACDLAPHWVGGFVDWGEARVEAEAAPGAGVEVGSDYAQFVEQLVRWGAGL